MAKEPLAGTLDLVGTVTPVTGAGGNIHPVLNRATLAISGGLAGVPGTGATLRAEIAEIDFAGDQTLASLVLSAGDSVALVLDPGTLTLGNQTTLAIGGAGDVLTAPSSATLVNEGRIALSGTGPMTVGSGAALGIANHGALAVTAGSVDLEAGVFANTALVSVSAGLDLVVHTALENTGTIALHAGGSLGVTLAAHPPGNQSAAISTFGTVENTGGTLAIGTAQFGDTATLASDWIMQTAGTASIAGGTITSDGTISVAGGSLTIAPAAFVNTGTIALSGGGIEIATGAFRNSGAVVLAGGTFAIDSALALRGTTTATQTSGGGTWAFAGGTLALFDTTTLAALGTLGGSDGVLEIGAGSSAAPFYAAQPVGVQGTGTLDLGGGTLTLGGGSAIQRLDVAGVVENGTIVLAGGTLALEAGGALIGVTELPCFVARTGIATPQGEVDVAALRPGDAVLTASGAVRTVRWIGERQLDCRRHARPELVCPVRVAAGAFGQGRPARDVRLSPDHAIHIPASWGGPALIPVKYLVNGASIRQEPAATVHYFHIELDSHDVLLAHGLAVESYLDTGNRAVFSNGGMARQLHPAFSRQCWEKSGCAPLVLEGDLIRKVRDRLLNRLPGLGWRLEREAAPRIRIGGSPLKAASVIGNLHRFLLPEGTVALTIESATGVPFHVDATSGDNRLLGACIGGVTIGGRTIPLDSAELATGFHPPESHDGPWRWTDGQGHLIFTPLIRPALLEILVLEMARRWVPVAATARTAIA